MPQRLCILGAGSWGTSLSIALAPRFETIALWCRTPDRAAKMESARENTAYLPGFGLPRNVFVTPSGRSALQDARLVLVVLPSHAVRATLEAMRDDVPRNAHLISATKGFELETLQRMSEVITEAIPGSPVSVISGPSFAREIAAGEPAALVAASLHLHLAQDIQQALSTSSLRFYTSEDPVGVEIGAALKNVIAIGAGICCGLGLGNNIVAALVTRGLAEITRLATKLGAQERTLSGLAGLGDLVLTTTGHLSRNRQVGIELGRGLRLENILGSMTMVAEGVATCRAARELAARERVTAPIIDEMHKVLYQGKTPREAIRDLMERPLTIE